MLKTPNYEITFAEIPDEITLCINVSGCPIHCKECHSKFLWEDVGEELTGEYVENLIEHNKGISCVCFMGGDADTSQIKYLAAAVNYVDNSLKVAWYSGRSLKTVKKELKDSIHLFDYVKVGPYKEKYGPLNNPKTNQHLYSIEYKNGKFRWIDITNKFWKK